MNIIRGLKKDKLKYYEVVQRMISSAEEFVESLDRRNQERNAKHRSKP